MFFRSDITVEVGLMNSKQRLFCISIRHWLQLGYNPVLGDEGVNTKNLYYSQSNQEEDL